MLRSFSLLHPAGDLAKPSILEQLTGAKNNTNAAIIEATTSTIKKRKNWNWNWRDEDGTGVVKVTCFALKLKSNGAGGARKN